MGSREATPRSMTTQAAPVLGTSPLRKEGRAKVQGTALYVDDLSLPGMWHGATVRSTVARGVIRSIHFAQDVPWAEYAVVRASDIPGENTVVHLTKDHPCLAAAAVNHPEEPVLLLAHPQRSALWRAVAGICIEYEELPGVFTIEESEAAVADEDTTRLVWDGAAWAPRETA